ncbi:phosphoglucosamine mutase [Ferruginivarius sediminum]|uniref:Phosphoglucosamine mutase n=1 Tax=Ferruginivarius sediminum TaxID=2661937 RepID=A0A369TBR6_9PROT|nr:phosphoglucosamine mutase [Ferruginivarius sediminum]RDD61964.1 phosphoglucosamine mutase [Ferruginivarius sediminum]
MTRKLFGTDGIRGTANREPITAETALSVAMAAGAQFRRGDHRHVVVIGKDTRLSGYMLEPALTSGFLSVGMDVVLLGPIPTPAVGMLTHSLRADLGVMISASHNPYDDNGIKLFGPDGFKLSDEVEAAIEHRIASGVHETLVAPGRLGRARRLDDANGRYIEFVKSTFPRRLRLDGLKIVVDCANGAAYKAAPRVLYELGAEVVDIACDPDGFNINHECGATSPGAMQSAVVTHGADLGLSLDGDADRLIVADERGKLIDGDQIMALITGFMQREERLSGNGLVATVMSNLGLERHLHGLGLDLIRTPVGDRYVVERMRADGFNIGGEQSGHIVLSDYTTTGDGLIAALQVLAPLVESGQPANELLSVFEPVPQKLTNVRVADRTVMNLAAVKEAVAATESRLKDQGRLVIRPSGTEPVIRIMAEGDDADMIGELVEELAEAIRIAGEGGRRAAP